MIYITVQSLHRRTSSARTSHQSSTWRLLTSTHSSWDQRWGPRRYNTPYTIHNTPYPMHYTHTVGPSQEQVTATITRHMTNPARFAVWPTGEPPVGHPVPPEAARPLVQWRIVPSLKTSLPTHALCCQLSCNFDQRTSSTHSPSAGHEKVRYEGMGLARAPPASEMDTQGVELVALFDWNCTSSTNGSINGSVLDLTLAPRDWKPSADEGPCMLVGNASSRTPSLYTYKVRSGPSAGTLYTTHYTQCAILIAPLCSRSGGAAPLLQQDCQGPLRCCKRHGQG
jgi:hypothetical protein